MSMRATFVSLMGLALGLSLLHWQSHAHFNQPVAAPQALTEDQEKIARTRATVGSGKLEVPEHWTPEDCHAELIALATCPKARPLPEVDTIRTLIFTRVGPVVMDMRVLVAGQTIAERRKPMIDALLADADTHRTGRSTWAEAIANLNFGQQRLRSFLSGPGRFDPPRRRRTAVECDLNSDGIMDRIEAERLWKYEFAPLGVSYQAPSRVKVFDLMKWLDVDGNGALSSEEIAQSAARLLRRDASGNEYLEEGECEPLPQSRAECPDCCVRRFEENLVCISHEEEIYCKAFNVIPQALPEWPEWKQHAGALPALLGKEPDWRKVAAAFKGMPSHLTFDLDFPADNAVAPRYLLKSAPAYIARCVQQMPDGRTELRFPGVTVLMDSITLHPRLSANAGRWTVERYDRDGNGYLDASEVDEKDSYGMINFDRNRDGKATVEEIDACLAWMSTPLESQVCLVAGNSATPLFAALDLNHDNALSLREMHQAPQHLRALDRNGNGDLSAAEIPVLVGLTIGRGDSIHPWTKSPEKTKANGDWFSKMDRNGDGDVSPREFLGSRQQFDKLDRDRDGLLDRREAAQASRSE